MKIYFYKCDYCGADEPCYLQATTSWGIDPANCPAGGNRARWELQGVHEVSE